MRILEYLDLDTAGVRPQYEKVRRLLEQEDFHAAQVKNSSPTTSTGRGSTLPTGCSSAWSGGAKSAAH